MSNKKINSLFLLFSIILFSCSANEEIDPATEAAINKSEAKLTEDGKNKQTKEKSRRQPTGSTEGE